jgi:hypothetical protein
MWFPLLVLDTCAGILNHCCYAWNKLIDQPWCIMTIGMCDWAYRFQLQKIDISTPIGVRAGASVSGGKNPVPGGEVDLSAATFIAIVARQPAMGFSGRRVRTDSRLRTGFSDAALYELG